MLSAGAKQYRKLPTAARYGAGWEKAVVTEVEADFALVSHGGWTRRWYTAST